MVRITKLSRTALKLTLLSAVLGTAIPMYATAVLEGTATGGTASYNNSVNVTEPPISQTLNWTCDTCSSQGFLASGSARVVNGALGAKSTLTVPIGSTVVAPKSESTAQFDDTLTITGGSGSGYLDLTFALDGSMTNTGTGTNYSQTGLAVLGVVNPYTSVNGGSLQGNTNLAILKENLAPATTNTVDFYVQFDYGTPFTITPDLYTVAQYYSNSGDTPPYTATADYYSTATITSARVFSSISNLTSPITTADIASTDGFNYGPNGLTVGGGLTTVPEPGTWLPVLLGLGLLGFAKGRFLRRKGARENA